ADDRQVKIRGHQPEDDREIGEQQPFDRRLHNSKTHQRVVDDTLSTKHEAPCKGADESACEEWNGETCEQERSPAWSAQQTNNRRGRNSEERGSRSRQRGETRCAEEDGCSSVLEQGRKGRSRPGGV